MSTPNFFPNFQTSSKNFNKLLKPKHLDLDGFLTGELYNLYGRHKVSKTTICIDTALNAIKQKAKVLYIDGDMGGVNFIRLNEILINRQDEEGIPKALPNSVFRQPKLKIEKAFKTHLIKHGLQLEVAHSLDEFKKFYYYLTSSPHLVIVDSATLFFRQEMVLGKSKYGAGVKTVDFAATTVRNYMMNTLKVNKRLVPAPNGTACAILTAQSKSDIGALARQAQIENASREGRQLTERDLQMERPFVGGGGIGFLSETFIEIIHDNSDPLGKRRLGIVWGSRNLEDRKRAYFKTTDKGIADA